MPIDDKSGTATPTPWMQLAEDEIVADVTSQSSPWLVWKLDKGRWAAIIAKHAPQLAGKGE